MMASNKTREETLEGNQKRSKEIEETVVNVVSARAEKKGKKAIEKNFSTLNQLKVEYVPVDVIKPNKYNPNRQSEHDFELLLKSMEEDGFTQPIVVQKSTNEIVDGEHRWRAGRTLGFKEIPVVYVEMSEEQMRIATLRHNRARGSEDIDLVSNVLKDLQELGALEHAMDSLDLSDIEVNRLIEDFSASEALGDMEEHTEAWEPSEVGDIDRRAAERGTTEAYVVSDEKAGGVRVNAMSEKAIEDVRERERRVAEAKTFEERQTIARESNLYRVQLIFSGEEGEIVKAVLGQKPAVTLLQLCKKALDMGITVDELKEEAEGEAQEA